MVDLEKAEQDLEWILGAVENPSYLLVKRDRSNMFELNDDSEGYVRYIIEELKRRGYAVFRSGHCISVK